MNRLFLAAFSIFLLNAHFAFSEQTTTVTVIEKPKSTTTLDHQVLHILATTTSSTFSTSVVQATRTQAVQSGGASGAAYNNGVNVEGGASGSDHSSIQLSTGGLIAVIVVVVFVVIFGIASVILYVVAKRRQWNIRASIRRASRRLTGRRPEPVQRSQAEKRKRSGVIAGSQKAGTTAAHPPGHKRGLVVQVSDDVEKGDAEKVQPKKKRENTWVGRLWGNDWK